MAAFFGANEIWKSYEGDGREPVVLAGVRETDVKVPVSEEEFAHSLDRQVRRDPFLLQDDDGAAGHRYADTLPYQ